MESESVNKSSEVFVVTEAKKKNRLVAKELGSRAFWVLFFVLFRGRMLEHICILMRVTWQSRN